MNSIKIPNLALVFIKNPLANIQCMREIYATSSRIWRFLFQNATMDNRKSAVKIGSNAKLSFKMASFFFETKTNTLHVYKAYHLFPSVSNKFTELVYNDDGSKINSQVSETLVFPHVPPFSVEKSKWISRHMNVS